MRKRKKKKQKTKKNKKKKNKKKKKKTHTQKNNNNNNNNNKKRNCVFILNVYTCSYDCLFLEHQIEKELTIAARVTLSNISVRSLDGIFSEVASAEKLL